MTLDRLADQLRARMHERGLRQRDVAIVLDRPPSRISEFIRSLESDRLSKDRLGLLVEMADGLGLELLLVPKERFGSVLTHLGQQPVPMRNSNLASPFDELFIELSEDEEDDGGDQRRPTRAG